MIARILLVLMAASASGCAVNWPWQMPWQQDGTEAAEKTEPETRAFPSTLDEVAAETPAGPELDIQQWKTKDGAKVLFVHSPALPMVDIRLVFAAGSARDDEPGTAFLTSALLGEGARGLTVDQIARGFEDRGAQFSTGSYRDMGVVELRSLTDPARLDPSVDLLARVIGEPTFPEDALERVRSQVLVRLARERQVPGPRAQKRYYRTLFRGHPYGHPPTGTTDTLPGISREDLQAFHRNWYAAGNAVIAIVGDLTEKQARQIAAKLSNALPEGPQAPPLPETAPPAEQRVEHLSFPSAQTILLLGNEAIPRGHPDWVPLFVGNQILGGGGFASILTSVVREEKGYVYGISSGFSPMAAGGPFTVQLQTANENANDALALTLKLVRDFVEDGPTEEQMQDAREHLLGNLVMSAAENDEIVSHLGMIGFYDLPEDYLQQITDQVAQVTREQVMDAFGKHVSVDRFAIVSVGPEAPAVPPQPDTSEGQTPQALDSTPAGSPAGTPEERAPDEADEEAGVAAGEERP